MKEFEIVMPIVGECYGKIKAKTKAEALKIFHEHWYETTKLIDVKTDNFLFSMETLDSVEKLVEGNVINVSTAWEASVVESEIKDGE